MLGKCKHPNWAGSQSVSRLTDVMFFWVGFLHVCEAQATSRDWIWFWVNLAKGSQMVRSILFAVYGANILCIHTYNSLIMRIIYIYVYIYIYIYDVYVIPSNRRHFLQDPINLSQFLSKNLQHLLPRPCDDKEVNCKVSIWSVSGCPAEKQWRSGKNHRTKFDGFSIVTWRRTTRESWLWLISLVSGMFVRFIHWNN